MIVAEIEITRDYSACFRCGDIPSPITSTISSIVAGKGSQLLYEHLTKEAAELRKTEQETKSSIEAEDLEPPRKHNKPKVKNPESASGQTHKVAAGDAIDKIAKNRGTTREKIIKDNPWLKDRIRTNARGQTIIDIFPGEHIIIPNTPAAGTPNKATADSARATCKPVHSQCDTLSTTTKKHDEYSKLNNDIGKLAEQEQKVVKGFQRQIEIIKKPEEPYTPDTRLPQDIARYILKIGEKYDEFARKNPNLAKYGLSAANIAISTTIGSIGGGIAGNALPGVGTDQGYLPSHHNLAILLEEEKKKKLKYGIKRLLIKVLLRRIPKTTLNEKFDRVGGCRKFAIKK